MPQLTVICEGPQLSCGKNAPPWVEDVQDAPLPHQKRIGPLWMLRATVQKAAWFCTVLVFMRVIIGSDLEGDCTILCTRTRPTTAVYVH